MTRKRDFLRVFTLRSRSTSPRSTSPQPTSPRSTSPQPTSPQPTSPQPSTDQPANTTDPATESTPGKIGNIKDSSPQNLALLLAISRHTEGLSGPEKEDFLTASKTITDKNILKGIKDYDAKHYKDSYYRPKAEGISKFLSLLNRLMGGVTAVASASQASPEISSMVLGGVRLVLDFAIKFFEYFTSLSEMLCQFGQILGPLAEFAKFPEQEGVVFEALANVYGDLLKFCQCARNLFVDEKNQPRNTSWTVLGNTLWTPFQVEFGTIKQDMQNHLRALDLSALAKIRNEILDASRRDQENQRIQDRKEFLEWISNLPSETVHEEIYAKKHPGTGEWLIKTHEFQNWFENQKSALLWCHGQPGAGKSVLSSNVINYVTTHCASRKEIEIGICFVYYHYKSQEMEDLSLIISALIKQLCRAKDTVPTSLMTRKNDSLPPSSVGNVESFITIAKEFDEVFLMIDGLDERPEEKRYEVHKFLSNAMKALPCLKVFVTSRREQDIVRAFGKLKTPTIEVEAKNVAADIRSYVTDEIKRRSAGVDGRYLFVKSPTLTEKIIQTLTDKADGMFLLVNLQIDHLCKVSQDRIDKKVEKALNALPPDLDETYIRLLDQIDTQEDYRRKLACSTLSWILYARRPLMIEEVQHALATDERFSNPDWLSSDFEEVVDSVDHGVILEACANLVTRKSDDRDGILRPVHYSLEEFLKKPSSEALKGRCTEKINDIRFIHTQLAMTCLLYLDYQIKDGPCKKKRHLRSLLQDRPFIWYAASSFDYHILNSGDLSDQLRGQILRFLAREDRFLTAVLQLRTVPTWPGYSYIADPDRDFRSYDSMVNASDVVHATLLYDVGDLKDRWKDLKASEFALHQACYGGSLRAVARILAEKGNVNQQDDKGICPVYYASSIGNLPILNELIENGANVNALGGKFGTALCTAIDGGHESIVNCLLIHDADVHVQLEGHGTPLQLACVGGQKRLVDLLLKYGADVKVQADGSSYGTALAAAAAGGNPEIVKSLLERGAEVNAKCGHYYCTALQAASREGYLDVVNQLIEKDADINAEGGKFGTALQTASHQGHLDVINRLIEEDVEINVQSGKFGTALQAASHRCHQAVVKRLIEEGAEVNAQGGGFGTALHASCKLRKGMRASSDVHRDFRKGTVELLLFHGADIHAIFKGRTALQTAVDDDLVEIVALLLSKGAKPDDRQAEADEDDEVDLD